MIKLSNINKFYNKGKNNEIHVVDNANIELPDFGFVVILGKSGSGKSTLLNVIGGLDKASGQIAYDDMTLNRYSPTKIDKYRNDNIGYIFQNYNNLNNFSVYENLRIALNIYYKLTEEEIEKRIVYCLNAVGLYKYRNKLCSELSGGQQQRVSIARALVKNPKIIIADEPTGNLDNANSIEVMNILSKVSKTRLVILVTHNEELAHFYADRILNIVDGKIISDVINNSNISSIDIKDNSNVYLKDLEHKVVDSKNVLIDLYSINDEEQVRFKLVKLNGKLYLESDLPIEVINNSSSVKLINAHYKAMDKAKVDDYEFSTDDFVKVQGKKTDFKKFIKNIWYSVKSTVNVRKRTKLGYVLFAVIGALTALSMLLLSSANYVDMTNYNIKQGYVIDGYNSNNMNLIEKNFDALVEEGLIKKKYTSSDYCAPSLSTNNVFVDDISIPNSFPDCYAPYEIVFGRKPETGEVVISMKLYEYIKKEYKNVIGIEMEDIVGLSIDPNSNGLSTKVISGISDDNQSFTLHFNEVDYYEIKCLEAYEFIHPNSIKKIYDDNVDIVFGRGIEKDNEVILPYSMSFNEYNLNDEYYIYDETYTVVGFALNTDAIYLTEKMFAKNCNIEDAMLYHVYNPYLELVSGRYPENENEVVASVYSDNEFSSYEVVGKFKPKNNKESRLLYISKSKYENISFDTIKDLYAQYRNGYFLNTYSLCIDEADVARANEILGDGLYLTNSYDFYYDNLVKTNSISKVVLPMAIVCLAIVAIYSFFMIRSKMMFDIKNIGILRAIGMRKRTFIFKYFIQSLILTTFTSVIGYMIFVIGATYIISSISILGTMFNLGVVYITFGIILLYIISILFGLLPVMLLLHKSPQEILNKYDI